MNIRKLIYIVVAFYCPSLAAGEVSKGSWIEHMKTGLPTYQCQHEKYFRQCFTVQVEKCEEVMASATRTCIDKEISNIPAVLNQPEDGRMWGAKIGSCAGIAYEMTLSKKRTNNARCNNIQNWK